jgi:hypothetical protein
MTERDPEKSGLVILFHPRELVRNDSPIWDDALSRITVKDLPKFERLDIIAVDGAARIYIFLIVYHFSILVASEFSPFICT